MDIARRFAALLCIVVSLLVPAGAGPAMAAIDHASQPDCPHAALMTPAGAVSQVMSHAMPIASGKAPMPMPAGPSGLPSCCNALPVSVAPLEPAPALVLALPGHLLRPRSDTMPTQRAIGPDLPPPRA